MTKLIGNESDRCDRTLLARLFAIDTRALAAMRIGFGLILVVQCMTDPLPVGDGPGAWNAIVRNAAYATLPFAVMLVAGYRTRIATISAWLLFGIPIREALFTHGVSLPLRQYTMVLFLFWMMFLPLAVRWSMDAKQGRGRHGGRYLSVASAGLLIQVFVIYLFGGAIKSWEEWVVNGDALYLILSDDRFPTALGSWLTQFPTILAFASRATMGLQVVGSILLLVPLKGLERRRVYLVAAFILLHVAMGLTMQLKTFPLVMIVIMLVFLPSSFWDQATGKADSIDLVETSTPRNWIAGVAVGYIIISALISWLWYPATAGLPELWQRVGQYLLLYQQWTMFSMPSTLG